MVSTTVVANIMVEDDDNPTFDGILIRILKFVEPSSTVGQQRITDDDGITTIMPRKSQDDIINCTLVSKRFHQIISNHEENGVKYWDIIPVLEIAPPPLSSGRVSSVRRLFNKLRGMSMHDEIDNKQHFRHITVNNIHEINIDVSDLDDMDEMHDNNGMYDQNGRSIQLHGIRSLQIFPPSTPRGNDTHRSVNNQRSICLVRYLLDMAPNIREFNLSSNNVRGSVADLSDCLATNIETIRWDNIRVDSYMYLDGFYTPVPSLKQISMDKSIFYVSFDDNELANYEEEDDVDNNNNNNNNNRQQQRRRRPNIFIFHQCCKKLERVSIRNAKYVCDDVDEESVVIVKCITQKALIKFVRNAPPTLVWFRSDLSPENMNMLRIDFPKIEFLN